MQFLISTYGKPRHRDKNLPTVQLGAAFLHLCVLYPVVLSVANIPCFIRTRGEDVICDSNAKTLGKTGYVTTGG